MPRGREEEQKETETMERVSSVLSAVSCFPWNRSMIVRRTYLNVAFGMKSWLLTTDHKRIAILYLISLTLMFFVGGAAATLIRLNLLTPYGQLLQADTYNKMFTAHGIIMVWFFLVPVVPSDRKSTRLNSSHTVISYAVFC